MGAVPRVPRFQVGDAGSAADVEGFPAMMLAQQPDAMIDAGQVGPLTIRAASVRGAGHRYDGTPRQDDFCLGSAGGRGEFLVAVVADGVSAGPRSHLASRVVVRLGVQLVAQAIANGPAATIDWDALVGTIAGHVLLQARKDRGNDDLDAREAAKVMASTAAFAIVPVEPDPNGMRTCIVVPIGDTSVWTLRGGRAWEAITPIKNEGAAVASSAVFALPLLPSAPIVALTTALRPGDALFVVTDGIGDPLGEGTGVVGRALATTWATPPNRYEFAAQVDLARRSHTDDRTAVGIWVDVPASAGSGLHVTEADAPPPAWQDLAAPAPPDPAAAPDASPPPAPVPAPEAEPDTRPVTGARTAPAPTGWVPSAGLPPSTRAAHDTTRHSASPYLSASPYGASRPYPSSSRSPYREPLRSPGTEHDPDPSDDDPPDPDADPAR